MSDWLRERLSQDSGVRLLNELLIADDMDKARELNRDIVERSMNHFVYGPRQTPVLPENVPPPPSPQGPPGPPNAQTPTQQSSQNSGSSDKNPLAPVLNMAEPYGRREGRGMFANLGHISITTTAPPAPATPVNSAVFPTQVYTPQPEVKPPEPSPTPQAAPQPAPVEAKKSLLRKWAPALITGAVLGPVGYGLGSVLTSKPTPAVTSPDINTEYDVDIERDPTWKPVE